MDELIGDRCFHQSSESAIVIQLWAELLLACNKESTKAFVGINWTSFRVSTSVILFLAPFWRYNEMPNIA